MKVDSAKEFDLSFCRELLAKSHDLVAVVDTDGNIIFMNPAMERFWGAGHKDISTMGKLLAHAFPDRALRAKFEKQWSKDAAAKDVVARELSFTDKQGSARCGNFKATKLSNGFILVNGHDVSELNSVRGELDKIRYAVDKASNAVFLIREDGSFSYVNEQACRLLGYSKKELLGMSVPDIDPIFNRKIWRQHWQEIRRKEHFTLETIHKRKDGTRFPVEVSINYHVFAGEEYNYAFARDVSDRKANDLALLESEQSFKSLTALAFEAILIHDDGSIIDANSRFYEMFGYSREDLANKNVLRILVPPKESKKIKAKAVGPDTAFYETIGIRKDGTKFPLEVRVREIEYRGKKVRAAALLDVTDRKKVEESLRESELKYRHIVEASPMGMHIYKLDAKDRLIFIGGNPAAEEILGVGNSQFQGKSIEDAFPGLKGTAVPEMFRKVARTGTPWHGEQVAYEHGNISGIYEVYAFQTVPNIITAAFVDITTKKKAEAELKRLAAAVESAAESIIITEADGTIIYVNPWFETMTGYARDEILGKNTSVFASGKHDDEFYKNLWDAITSGDTWSGRFTNKKKDGTLFEEEAVISPVKDDKGKILNYVAVKRDVTQEMMLENQVLQSQKMAAIGQLAHRVAHNFTNVLVMILGNAQLARERLPAGSEVAQYLSDVIAAANRVSTLTAELLAFAHPTELSLKTIRLDKLFAGMEDLLKETVEHVSNLQIDIKESKMKIKADPVQIEQVMLHLAINADEAMRDQKGKLTITAGPSDFGSGYAMITVADTGRGLDEETRQHIFEPFFSTKQTNRNPGLGLATVYSIITQHGGLVSVESKLGKGTTFKIYLPAEE